MKTFSPEELSILNYAVSVAPNGNTRTFTTMELDDVNDIVKKLVASTQETPEGRMFISGSLEFTSAQNVFLHSLINELQWTAAQGVTVLNTLKLLK